MPANSSYSPTMVEKKSSLDIMSNIADNMRAIAKDLAEYVEIKTGKASSPHLLHPMQVVSLFLLLLKLTLLVVSQKNQQRRKRGFLLKCLKYFHPVI